MWDAASDHPLRGCCNALRGGRSRPTSLLLELATARLRSSATPEIGHKGGHHDERSANRQNSSEKPHEYTKRTHREECAAGHT